MLLVLYSNQQTVSCRSRVRSRVRQCPYIPVQVVTVCAYVALPYASEGIQAEQHYLARTHTHIYIYIYIYMCAYTRTHAHIQYIVHVHSTICSSTMYMVHRTMYLYIVLVQGSKVRCTRYSYDVEVCTMYIVHMYELLGTRYEGTQYDVPCTMYIGAVHIFCQYIVHMPVQTYIVELLQVRCMYDHGTAYICTSSSTRYDVHTGCTMYLHNAAASTTLSMYIVAATM